MSRRKVTYRRRSNTVRSLDPQGEVLTETRSEEEEIEEKSRSSFPRLVIDVLPQLVRHIAPTLKSWFLRLWYWFLRLW